MPLPVLRNNVHQPLSIVIAEAHFGQLDGTIYLQRPGSSHDFRTQNWKQARLLVTYNSQGQVIGKAHYEGTNSLKLHGLRD